MDLFNPSSLIDTGTYSKAIGYGAGSIACFTVAKFTPKSKKGQGASLVLIVAGGYCVYRSVMSLLGGVKKDTFGKDGVVNIVKNTLNDAADRLAIFGQQLNRKKIFDLYNKYVVRGDLPLTDGDRKVIQSMLDEWAWRADQKRPQAQTEAEHNAAVSLAHRFNIIPNPQSSGSSRNWADHVVGGLSTLAEDDSAMF